MRFIRLTALFTLSSIGCFDDLPEPLTCPPQTITPAGNCLEPIQTISDPGCYTLQPNPPEIFECLAGPRTSCDCGMNECDTSVNACYPTGDCPPEVRSAAGDNAECLRLGEDDFKFPGVPQIIQCICGCTACATVCDGKGPVVGLLDVGDMSFAALSVRLDEHMPERGKVGVYVRARGLSNLVAAIFTGDIDGEDTLVAQRSSFVFTPLDQFTEFVMFDDGFISGDGAYAWKKNADKPTLLAFFTQGSMEAPQAALYEVDCIIPFIVPTD
jgi:hypothetical protein